LFKYKSEAALMAVSYYKPVADQYAIQCLWLWSICQPTVMDRDKEIAR